MAVANGSNHLGATTSIFPADERLIDYLKPRAREPFEVVAADHDAHYSESYEYDLNEFEPLISGPDDIRKLRPISDVEGTKVQAAYIGSCSGGRFEDLRLAAQVLRDRKIHPEVRMVVTPISSQVMREAAEKGLLAIFTAAGAALTTPGCGSCFAPIQSPLRLEDEEVCISASVENYPGRMGSEKAKIYLGNAAVVAASAVAGQIANPLTYL
jgi:3-isopropylmalate/(R)-2-methylmalate dehydratase large subunit